ncbi:family 20 glycosylhydrolase [Maribellus maritimus]|uniref:family 20 glycosylhydrolase n=1 Tax=Maribellus maritimus TaxID=2870838 RepID=UPI001EEAF6FD|nr:family 20 glycosylhydrolase [Maribellus maritimus]MCG6190533.1 family 20 glycosylhydrolase [Maribellus maritimus]
MKYLLVAFISLYLLASCSQQKTPGEIIIIPQPKKTEQNNGSYKLTNQLSIATNTPQLDAAASYLKNMLSRATGFEIKSEHSDADILLELTDLPGKEGAYQLTVSKSGIKIKASSYAGIISGISTLRQLLPPEIELSARENHTVEWNVPVVNISDEPRFSYRGLHLDVSRHFFTKEEVKNLLDLMAMYKLNKFHWHLTDDQGWRIEIKQYPLLTEKGAWRKFNNQDLECLKMAQEQDNADFLLPSDKMKVVNRDTLYGGYYTQEDIREVVAFAKDRGIDIVPEIDMPGHFLAAIENYDGISCFKQTGWGKLFSSPICPGKESALEFCKNVYSEVFKLFPYEYVHLGADEVDKANWKKCPDCQKRMHENSLKTEEELQAWFVKYMEKFFNENKKKLIGWDEIIEGGLSPSATIMWWRGWVPDAVPRATATGNQAIVTTSDRFYFDYKPAKNTLKDLYEYEPVKSSLSDEQKKLVIGVQANIWTEWIPTVARLHYQILPRMLALSEVCWHDTSSNDWARFQHKIDVNLQRFNLMGIKYYIPPMEGMYKTNMFIGETNVDLKSGYNKATIHYTTDGSFPTKESELYAGPIKIEKTTNFSFRYFYPDGSKGDIFETKFIKGEYTPGKDTTLTHSGLKALWHEYRGSSCREIEKAPLNGEYTAPGVAIPEDVQGNIGLVLTGFINVSEKDIYTFKLLSDDGSVMYIDNEEVVNNDGAHSPREVAGMKALDKGLHPIKVLYFDSNGGKLQLTVLNSKGENISETENLYRF